MLSNFEVLNHAKEDVLKVLARLHLIDEVSLDEIHQELESVETAFESLMILGILRRIMAAEDDRASKLFIPAITHWKNCLPHRDLGGLSPLEHMQRYPPGKFERRFTEGLFDKFESVLDQKELSDDLNIEAEFEKFQNDYFNQKIFITEFGQGQPLTLKQIIIAERKQNGYPEDLLNSVGAKLFAENTAEGTGMRMAEIEDYYYEAINDLAQMQGNPRLRSRRRVKQLRILLEKQEPYHRLAPEAHRFYLNFAQLTFLDEDLPTSQKLLAKALRIEPDYGPAQEFKKRLESLN